jgi:flagellar basal-body rod modification protein FlgD
MYVPATATTTTQANAASTTSTSSTGLANQQLDQGDFLSLLVTELMSQDPMDPLADRDFIAQVAQLNTLTETMQLNQNFQTMQMLQATSLMGRQVEAIGPNGDHVQGTVTGVYFMDSKPWVVIDDNQVVDVNNLVHVY